MSLKHNTSSAIALGVAALLILGVGIHTDNGGFQLAGGLVLVAGMLLAFSQAGKRDS